MQFLMENKEMLTGLCGKIEVLIKHNRCTVYSPVKCVPMKRHSF